MPDDLLRRERAKRTLTAICWSIAIGLCVVLWAAGIPRLAQGIQAWQTGGAEATVTYPPGRYKGVPIEPWSESAHSAITAGLGWCTAAVILTTGLVGTYLLRTPRSSKPPE